MFNPTKTAFNRLTQSPAHFEMAQDVLAKSLKGATAYVEAFGESELTKKERTGAFMIELGSALRSSVVENPPPRFPSVDHVDWPRLAAMFYTATRNYADGGKFKPGKFRPS